jgi:5-methylcytosine-specific restriction endonuclease McrA
LTKIKQCLDHDFIQHDKINNACVICLRKYNAEKQRELYARVRVFLNQYRLASGCAFCGYAKNAAALQFDHINPVKRKKGKEVPQNMSDAKKLISDSNVQVLCANCHCIKTRENKDYKARSTN